MVGRWSLCWRLPGLLFAHRTRSSSLRWRYRPSHKGLRNIRNHLDVDPKAKIVAVAHAEGVDFLMEGAMSTNNQQFAALGADLMARGVTFEICEITLKNRNLKKEQFILGPTFTPSGVVRIANLQAREHFAYLKP